MEKAGMKWIGYHTNKLPHFGCNTTNRVEGSHAVLKRLIKSSNGRLDKVFDEVDIWYRKIVSVWRRSKCCMNFTLHEFLPPAYFLPLNLICFFLAFRKIAMTTAKTSKHWEGR
jgi:hypothetical protein